MNSYGLGHQLKPCARVVLFMIFLMSMTLVYQYYDAQYSPYIDYSTTAFMIKNYNESQINLEDIAKGYVVWNPLCRIPDIDPYHSSIKKFIFKWKPVICSKLKPLTSVVYNSTTRRHTLKVNSPVVHSYTSAHSKLVCCYWIITRQYLTKRRSDLDDDRYNKSKAVCFKNSVELPASTENIYVACSLKKKNVYKTVHFMVVDKEPKSAIPSPADGLDKAPMYSVLLFGIDSISRLNFIRTLPKTREYVENRGWLPLKGYTKIADNTFPNLMAVLTGMTVNQLTKLCFHSPKKKVDDCPFMWKNFSENGYLTSYTEDTPSIGTFNYHKYGFMNSPTDYYYRPIMVAASELLPIKNDGGMDYCYGQHPEIEYLFQFNTEFIQRYHHRPYFNLFWANSYSHNELNMPSVMDERILVFLQDIDSYLNNTVVVFFSDHGMRFGKVRETYIGWLEERMPFIYFHLPPSLVAAQPHVAQNLRANKNRLTSPFDLHATLQQLLYGRVVQPAAGCPQCDSLFAMVPHNRSCEDAAITSHWCTCSVDDSSDSVADARIIAATELTINAMNGFLQLNANQLKGGYRCATLSFSKVMTVRTKVGGLSTFYRRQHIIVFETEPSKAVFEITWPEGAMAAENVEEISRINMYGNQSACVNGSGLLKLFCFCVKK